MDRDLSGRATGSPAAQRGSNQYMPLLSILTAEACWDILFLVASKGRPIVVEDG
jgi:hypothetical protein